MSLWTAVLACVGATPADDAGRLARISTLTADHEQRFPGVPELSAADEVGRTDVVWVDVRSPAERAVSTLPGAVDAEVVDADPTRWRGRTLVAYCTIGERSGRWALARRQDGLDVANLRDGVLGWTHAGGALVDPSGRPTRRVHVYGARWNLAATAYEATW